MSATTYSRVRLNHDYFYPVKTVSRSVAKRRLRRNVAYAASVAFAFFCTAMISPRLTFSGWEIAEHAPMAITAIPAPITETAAIPEPAHKALPRLGHVPVYPLTLALKVENGDTLTALLTDAGVSADQAQRAVNTIRSVYDVRKLDIGRDVSLKLDKNPDAPRQPLLAGLDMPISASESLHLTRQDNGFSIKIIDLPLQNKLTHAGGRIDSSLYETAANSGVPATLIDQIINAYSYDVDFQRDIQPGDRLDVLYEQLKNSDGKVVGHGNVLFTELTLSDGRDLKLYRYVDQDGNVGYYNAKGENIRKALLRTPIPGARITSGYGMRLHPILGYSKMHRGVDFGAPTGTPIYAAGDAVVEFEGWHGGYGKFMLLKHNSTYSTAYAHINRFATGIHAGSHVKQGQIIAYVGQTGMATGPHLHFEVRINGEQVNPASVKFKTGETLQGRELVAFHNTVRHIEQQLASLPPRDGKLAMNVQ